MELPLTPPTQPGALLPLSLPQREVWLDQMAWPGSSHLNIGGCGFIVGPFDPALFRRALDRLVEETEALRLVPLADGRQYLLTRLVPKLTELDLSETPDPPQAMQAWWQRQLAAPFPADGHPPWRFALLRSGPELHALTIQFHHLVMDGWGTTQIVRRWSELYNDLAAGRIVEPGRALPYRQFVDDSTAYRDSPAFARDGDWWLALLGCLPPALIERRYGTGSDSLPAAHLHTQRIAREDYRVFEDFAADRGVTPFSVMLAAVALYFARTRGCDRVVIGVPTLNREGKRYLATPGMFVGVMPLVLEVGAGATATDLIAAAQHSLRDALRHARYPLGETARRVKLLREHRSGLFDVLLSYERQDYAIRFGEARSAGSRQLFSGIARYPLGITLCEFASEYAPAQDPELILEGSAACYRADEVGLLARRLWHLVRAIAAAPDAPVADIDLLPSDERRALLDDLHRDIARHETPPSFVELFEQQARLRPEAVALVWDEGTLSYGELEARSRRVAHALSSRITGRDTIIALALDRGPDMVAALLAIARAGAAFLPLDPEAPADRLCHILAASGAAALLIDACHRRRLGSLTAHVLDVETLASQAAPASAAVLPPPARVTPAVGDLAYVLYTSGSTGEPKGVMIEHGALARRLAWLSRTWRIDGTDRSAQITQATFDPALVELLLPLIHGASIALPPPGRLSAQLLADFVVRHGATFAAFVPSTLERFLDALEDSRPAGLKLRVACCGGEVLPPELADRFLRITGGQLYNVYGPTETVIFATAWPCERQTAPASAPLSIGRCIDDTRIYVLDDQQRPLPFGECGEICIGGGTVARGYLGHAGTAQTAFCADPFLPGGRLYRTGDRGWLGVDGNLHFAGRLDRQIKLRGYRIEPGEIEAALQDIDGVFRAAVQLIAPDGHPRLHAWAAVRPGIDGPELLAALRRRLPDYMVPGGIACMGALPETPSGKIDYAVLPAPTFSAASAAPRPPAPGLETTLAELWSQALAKPVANANDDFFALGGDSLAAIDIVTGIETRLGQRIPLQLLTEHPTIAALARALEQQVAPILRPLVRLGGDPEAPPLFLVASGHGDLLRFQALADRLDPHFDVYMLQPPQAAGEARADLTDLAELYAQQIIDRKPASVCLAGFSIGGVTALETARRLQAEGMRVDLLALIDTLYPHAFLRARRLWQLSGWLIRRLHIQELSMNGRRLGALFSDAGLLVQVEALGRYALHPYDGPALLIKSSGLLAWQRWLFAPWRKLMTSELTETETPGLHGSLFEPTNLGALADILRTQAGALPRDRDAA
jgi:amino acid adenylation domain-containing protein